MARPLKKVLKVLGLVIAVVAVTLLGVRLYTMQQGPALELWHTYLPDELHARKLDKMSWREFVQHEDRLFEAVRQHVNARIESDDRVEGNRYFDGAKVNPGHFAHDWNRSYVLTPEGEPVGAAVLLHGLTDSPYVLRHIARHYQSVGYVVVAIRLPGHGTVPASLTDVGWHDWLAATRLAVREARRRVPAPRPLHMVGFSNGGALALMHSMQARPGPAGSPCADIAHGGGDALCGLCRPGGLAGRVSGVRQGGLAARRAGVQPVQIQLLSDQGGPRIA
ncbi:alpha/beta hydrolase [Pusillimonas noertemannii]|uniref:alpha/beta hydrolase n=1 Tax=Pusillimonas noertemannii TaxID=305977 RepID=UPI00030E9290|nr:alpha/beta hydrolase [Pusillimonas noertemannii]